MNVAVDGAELHVEVVGEGRPIVFVHGLGLSGALWDRMRDSFGSGYRLITLDLRGAGRSRELERTDLSLARWAGDLRAVVRELELERPVLVGASLGATVALKYALEQPRDVGALVLLGTEANLSNLAPRMLAAAERIFYPLWDFGFAVGHAVRTVRDCQALAAARLDAATALLDARLLAGDEDLFGRMRERVLGARRRQRERNMLNALLSNAALREYCPLDTAGRRLTADAVDRGGMSARAVHRALRVARTIADLANEERMTVMHLAEALQYRAYESRRIANPN